MPKICHIESEGLSMCQLCALEYFASQAPVNQDEEKSEETKNEIENDKNNFKLEKLKQMVLQAIAERNSWLNGSEALKRKYR